jgi:hypothetical protein
MVEIQAEASEVIRKKTDDRGRITLGAELAEREVEVAILDVDDEE